MAGWTSNGLSRFDGDNFYNFKGKAGPQDDAIAALETGHAGELWILTNSGKRVLPPWRQSFGKAHAAGGEG